MKSNKARNLHRRSFLKLASAAGAWSLAPSGFAASVPRVCIVMGPGNPAASGEPVKRAVEHLKRALEARKITVEVARAVPEKDGASFCIVVTDRKSSLARGFPQAELAGAESLRMAPGTVGGLPGVLISAGDARGFVYALLELAERVQYGDDALRSLQLSKPLQEAPANQERGVSRYFCSELEDKPWYYDKQFWSGYLDRLVASRFNRFTMGFGLEYDFPRGVTDDYFHFVYPYLVEVPGYPRVKVMQLAAPDGTRLPNARPLSAEERARNLEMLRFIAAETASRGMQFHLGIWTHADQWTDSPHPYHRIEGLTPDNHARYCRDALAMILKLCPEIQGLTMRVHGESGIPEGSYEFWRTVFEAIANAGRTIEIDMHAKGVDEKIIDIAVATGMPVKLGAKYSAEHQSLGYQQADIRALEVPHGTLSKTDETLFRFSSGSRSFTRYGYADFLRQGTRYKLWFRLWPGTQRHLLSVDAEMAAAYGRTASFCGATGLDLMEPLTFKGREGSGQPGGRCAYVDASLNPRYDWEKYDLYYRVWGRKLYNPDAEPETWRRAMRTELGGGTEATENALAHASRILPLLTSAHLPSASNHDLWYELPMNMPIVEGSEPSPYGDTPVPKIFSTVSPLDPQMFSSVSEYAKSVVEHAPLAKYSPIDVAGWLDDCVHNAGRWLDAARRASKARRGSAFRRIEEDVLIQTGLGTFFAYKLRSAVLLELCQQTEDANAGREAMEHYQKARDAWAAMAERAKSVYVPNISYGSIQKRSGHWLDRQPQIDADLNAMKAKVQLNQGAMGLRGSAAEEMDGTAGAAKTLGCKHTPPQAFAPGQALALQLAVGPAEGARPVRAVRLCYRHVNQAERWQLLDAKPQNGGYAAAIPKEYTQSEFGLEYYFELTDGTTSTWMYPGLNQTLSSQPYFAVCKRTKGAS